MDLSKKFYASNAALDLSEATSLPLNSHLHHLLLTKFGITDIQTCKAALSDSDTLTYDQVVSDADIEEWKKRGHKENNTITMTQPGLIKNVIEATGMELCSANKTPTSQTALGSGPEGSSIKETWKYSSVVGMILYLCTNTRPDIAFAVSQADQFNSNPKKSHASALRMIIRYLLSTYDKAIIFTPTTDFKVDCCVDADLSGLHSREPQILKQDTS